MPDSANEEIERQHTKRLCLHSSREQTSRHKRRNKRSKLEQHKCCPQTPAKTWSVRTNPEKPVRWLHTQGESKHQWAFMGWQKSCSTFDVFFTLFYRCFRGRNGDYSFELSCKRISDWNQLLFLKRDDLSGSNSFPNWRTLIVQKGKSKAWVGEKWIMKSWIAEAIVFAVGIVLISITFILPYDFTQFRRGYF